MAGVLDLATSRDSQALYGRIGNGTIAGWLIQADGSLVSLGATAALPAGATGLAAS